MTLPKHTFALVLWHDAHSPAAGDTYTATSISEVHGSLPVLTAGWVLRDNADGISLAAEWYVDEPDFRGVTYVPRAMIVEVRVVAVATSVRTTSSACAGTLMLTSAPVRSVVRLTSSSCPPFENWIS